MAEKEIFSHKADVLRQRAEEKAVGMTENLEAMSLEEIRRILHELHVHQIELEMQNDHLQRAHVEIDAARERYHDLYDLAPIGYFTLSEHGLFLEANLAAFTMLGVNRGTLIKQRPGSFSKMIMPSTTATVIGSSRPIRRLDRAQYRRTQDKPVNLRDVNYEW